MTILTKYNVLAALGACLLSAPALAADIQEAPVVEVQQFGGWYLRGDIGMSNQRLDKLDYSGFDAPEIFGWHNDGDFDAGITGQIGVGYQFNDWLRADVTAQYRGKTEFSALDYYSNPSNPAFGSGTNEYSAKKSEWLFLANAYADLGTYAGITPYIGAGIGASRNTISEFRDVNVLNAGGGYAGSNSEWNLAWALHAGVGIQATERMTIDLGYSYVDLGDAKTGTFYNDNGSTRGEQVTFKDITSHDFKLGVRYAF
ncbi:porin family protein [Phyllobacterium sp. 21LDTY02-6]|uniref:outer membrane protein n=1 Tax=unclassified Phyllobacterium TaxID=2638441 RepID=UPI0020205A59|nr:MULTISPECIES: outer membrane protein [unclassified Phyllobacterium]MCO4317659.1 porin family protein [Phyllobacterium sp. 21LDTY02-6]MCX8292968.1 porin family protein [Phyllobacterium sp. 0TCS1.6A]